MLLFLPNQFLVRRVALLYVHVLRFLILPVFFFSISGLIDKNHDSSHSNEDKKGRLKRRGALIMKSAVVVHKF